MNTLLLIAGLTRVGIWFLGAIAAYTNGHRWAVLAFAGMGINTLLSAIGAAGNPDVSNLTTFVVGFSATPVAGLLVWGYIVLAERYEVLRKAYDDLTERITRL